MKNKNGFIMSTYVYILLVFFLLLLGTLLLVMNNTRLLSNKLKTQIDTSSKNGDYTFTLIGDAHMYVMQGNTFYDPGVSMITDNDRIMNDQYVTTTSTVDTETIGTYKVTYVANYKGKSKRLVRTVHVTEYKATYAYTGDYQEFTPTSSGYYKIETWGAEGGTATSSYPAGKGAYSSGYIYLTEGEKLYIYVGGAGSVTSTEVNQTSIGGYNGGGDGHNNSTGSDRIAGSGGGATDIRYFGSTEPTSDDLASNSTLGLNSRIMVAAGGGGSWYNSTSYYGSGGAGGTLIGDSATGNQNGTTVTATGATQTTTTFGIGLSGGSSERPGGGGGYYGGNNTAFTSGGGSSFISGYAGVNAITSSSDRTHTNNTLHYSEKYFIDGSMESGVNSGNGKATITYVGNNMPRTNTDLNNVRYIKDCINGSSLNSYDAWVELQAIKNGNNIAKNKQVTSTGSENASYPYSRITDGDITTTNFADGTNTGNQCITIDLGQNYDLDEIAVWHYFEDGRMYNNNVTSVSSDNSNWTEVMNYDAVETANGKRVNAWD